MLPELDAMVGDGLITLEKVEVLGYRGTGPTAAAPGPWRCLRGVNASHNTRLSRPDQPRSMVFDGRVESTAAATARTPSLRVADGFELDLAARVLRHGSKPFHLRPIEFRLLAALAGAPGRAFTRRQLLDTAWPSRPPVDLRTVDVHVHWLRSKIEREPSRPTYLVTVRGYGYRLDPPAPLTIP